MPIPQLLTRVRELLEDAFGADYAEEDWQNALGGWHVVVIEHDRVVAHASVVPRTIEVGDRAVPHRLRRIGRDRARP